MLRILRLTVVLSVVSVCMAVSVQAQTIRPGSETENMLLSAVTRLNDNDIDGAKDLLSALLAEDSDNDAAWYYLAMAAMTRNEMAEAEEYLKMAVSLDPDNFWYRYRLAGIYGASQRQELTMDMYEKLLEDFPKRSELYLDMMELYATQGEYEKALSTIEEVETVLGMNEPLAMYRYRLAGIYGASQRQELTVDMYEKLLEDFPKRSELYLDMMELYATQGEYEKALSTIEEVETVLGMNEPLAMYRFNLLRSLGRHEEAYASLEKYNEEYSSPYVLATLADWQMSMYNDSTALSYYNEALELAPDYTPALLGKAETYRLTRKYDEYFKVLDGFVSMEDIPAPAKSEYLLAVVQRTDPKFVLSFSSQLDSVMTRTIALHPEDSTVLQTAGVYFYSTDRKDKAKEYFGKNAATWSESLPISATFVEFLMYAEDWEALSEEGRKAFDKFPQETAFLEMASVGDYNLKRYEDVLRICEKVLEVAPNDSSSTLRAWSTMGDIYHTLGDAKKSYKAYDKALKVNPDYVYVLNNYAYYLSVEGKNLKKAYAMSKKTIEAEPNNSTYLDTFGWILYLQGKPDQAKSYFKQAMLYGGKDSPVILDHYAEVLYALKEYDMAFVYWNLARQKNAGDIPDLEEKIEVRKKAVNK